MSTQDVRMKTTVSLEEYISLAPNGVFTIASYQRGYIWGQEKTGQENDSVKFMLDSLFNGKSNFC